MASEKIIDSISSIILQKMHKQKNGPDLRKKA